MFLFSILILFFGLVIFAFNIYNYYQSPTKLKKSYLIFFAALSYQLILAIVTLYIFLNIGLEERGFFNVAILVFLGMSFLEYTYFNYQRCKNLMVVKKKHLILLYTGIFITGIQSIIITFVKNQDYIWIPILLAFIPFIILVIYLSFLQLKVKDDVNKDIDKNLRKYIIFMGITIVIAVFEIIHQTTGEIQSTYFVISLPLTFLITSLYSISNMKKLSSPRLKLSSDLIDEFKLSKRETEIVDLVVGSKSNKEIAYDLKISENTVRNHIYNAYQKMGIQKRMDLVSLISK